MGPTTLILTLESNKATIIKGAFKYPVYIKTIFFRGSVISSDFLFSTYFTGYYSTLGFYSTSTGGVIVGGLGVVQAEHSLPP